MIALQSSIPITVITGSHGIEKPALRNMVQAAQNIRAEIEFRNHYRSEAANA